MSSFAIARGVVLPRASSDASGFFSRRGSDVLLTIALMVLGAALLVLLPGDFGPDSWLSLVGGRELWQSGLPHQETLTALSHGAPWVDQQWLSQLVSYGLFLLGGLGLLGLTNVALIMLGVGTAVVGARRLGADPRAVLLILPVCLWLIVPFGEVRTQEFAIPLFVATAYLLAADSRRPGRRVYWSLPILVLWGNLHGTVTLGALLVALRGATVAWERRDLLTHSLRAWRRPLILALGAPLCLLLTPYGLDIVSYYREMLLASSVRQTVTEWQPITSAFVIAVPFFIAAALAVWSFGRHPSRTTLWERLALLALAAGSVVTIRNTLFFALCALIVLPLSLKLGRPAAAPPAARGRSRINGPLSAAALAALLVTAAATLIRPASTFELRYQRTAVLAAVTRATRENSSLKVFADARFADWLLWRDPGLRGRIAGDARFELLTPSQATGLQRLFGAVGPDWRALARGYRLIVLDAKADPDATRGFLSETGRRVLYDDGHRLVILRNAVQAGAPGARNG